MEEIRKDFYEVEVNHEVLRSHSYEQLKDLLQSTIQPFKSAIEKKDSENFNYYGFIRITLLREIDRRIQNSLNSIFKN